MRGMASKGIPIYPYAATPTTQPPRLKKSGGSKRKPKSTSRGHQLDPGTKHRSGGYIASSPSGPGATNPRGKKLEYKHEATKRKAQLAGSVYSKAFFAATVDTMAHNAKQNKVPKPGDVRSKGSAAGHVKRGGPATPTTMPRRKLP